MAAKRTTRSRAKNFGEGNLFNFHGAYEQKADAVAKEAMIPGAFIKPAWYKHGMRFAVLTKRNPKDRRRNVEFGTFENGVFHPWTRRPKTRKKRAVRRLKVRNVDYPTTEELRKELGDNWVVARRTKRILAKYGPTVKTYTPKRFREAQLRILDRRKKNSVTWGGRRKNVIAWGQGDQDYMRKALRELYPGRSSRK